MTDRTPQRQRERALFAYANALERGDFETVARILHMAETDAILDRMIAELHTADEAALHPPDERPAPPDSQQQTKARGIQIKITFRNRFSPNGRPPKPESDEEENHMNAVIQPVNQRAQQYLTLAAALLVFVLLGGLALNMIPNQFFRPLTPRHVPALAVITPENAAQIEQIGFLGRGQITDAAWSPDNRTLALASTSGIIWLYNPGDLNVEPQWLSGHTGGVFKLAFSGDGKTLASIGVDKTLRLWDMNTHTERLHIEDQDANTLALTPDGKRVAISNRLDRDIKIWDADSGREIITLGPFDRAMNGIAFSPDGSIIVAASQDQLIYILNVNNQTQLATLPGHEDIISSIAFNPDGSMFASGDADGIIRLWDWNGVMGTAGVVLHGHETNISKLAFSFDGNTMASSSIDGVVRLWNLDAGAEQAVLDGHSDRVTSLTFSPDNKTLASVSLDESLRLWDVATGAQVNNVRIARGLADTLSCIAFSPDGTTIATSGFQGNIVLWDTTTLQPYNHLKVTGFLNSVAYSPDSSLLAAVKISGGVHLFDTATGEERLRVNTPTETFFVSFGPDAKTFISGGSAPEIPLWDTATGQKIGAFPGHERGGTGWVFFSPDYASIASLSWSENNPHVVDVASGQIRLILGSGSSTVQFSPDGSMLASADSDGTIHLWSAQDGHEIRVLEGHTSNPNWTVFSPDGRLLASGAGTMSVGGSAIDNSVRVWDVETGQPLFRTDVHTESITAMGFTTDGRMLVTGSEDGTIRLWGVPTGE